MIYIKYIRFLIHKIFLKNTFIMTKKFTILFDLDGTLVDTAPDLMRAHNQKYFYEIFCELRKIYT